MNGQRKIRQGVIRRLGFLLGFAACAPARRAAAPAPDALGRAESLYAAVRTLDDRLDIATMRVLPESAADLRTRINALHGDFTLGDATWYGFVRERIYRFGLERSSRRVMEDVLGRPVTADALLADLNRSRRPAR